MLLLNSFIGICHQIFQILFETLHLQRIVIIHVTNYTEVEMNKSFVNYISHYDSHIQITNHNTDIFHTYHLLHIPTTSSVHNFSRFVKRRNIQSFR